MEGAPGTPWIGGWVGPRAVLDTMVKRKIPSPHRELTPITQLVRPVAQRYTDWTIAALILRTYSSVFSLSTFCSHTRNTGCPGAMAVLCAWLLRVWYNLKCLKWYPWDFCYLTNSMVQSPRDFSTHSPGKIPRLLWNSKVHYIIHNSLPLFIILIRVNPIHIFPPCSPKISSGFVFSSTPTRVYAKVSGLSR
jgi:hypothetical protein